ncbi:MAG: serine/threonine protein kinase [Candidatus Eisenbacteria bacterium]|uniref:Serine/threonine protein kinase n=1 Tax=Eiseniibacteriota bacterium TaxID=2212470 RepID=A0A933SDE8_UNCEI|nr:serine/threonine protein kinase [Candidatus Eisenbacteria bacterium]
MTPSTPNQPARHLPGEMIAGRYRVVALLGRGGMGEVYRADDLKLGEPVALKFLPERFETDSALRDRLLGEARLARQVAHPNVCRVYDVGEVDGRLFLSMEYVDGEDLATLLRRIGRLPNEKALQLARQMCAGLQVAHELGIVHRDLKPSNIMIDGRGRARITDFGLAAIAESLGGAEMAAGTPAYMAPEQMEGREVTVRSDVYALGLVLYELFTGAPAFEGRTAAELLDAKRSRTPSSPSQLAPGTDPLVERVLLRCLSPDPAARPASAADVARALPGGDPLAAAIAAGETPSPEMIAEAAEEDPTGVRKAWTYLAVFAACMITLIALAPRYSLIRRVPIEKPPAVLVDRAREISTQLGWTAPPRDEWSVLMSDSRQAPWLGRKFGKDSVTAHLQRSRGGSLRLVYRRSPWIMRPLNGEAFAPGVEDPPLVQPGMLRIDVDGSGRLMTLLAVPSPHDSTAPPAVEPNPAQLFALAGLDTAAFTPVAPEWTPPSFADRRLAWAGRVPGDTAIALRVEAAWHRGHPVLFRLIHPWIAMPASAPSRAAGQRAIAPWILWIVVLGLLFLAARQARLNLASGRADARGALRFSVATGALLFARLMLSLHWNADPNFLGPRLLTAVARASLMSLIMGSLYLTLEPILRGTRPVVLVSWMRLLDGRFRDARVGRDLLAGFAWAAALHLFGVVAVLASIRFTHQPIDPVVVDNSGAQTDALMGTAWSIVVLLGAPITALQMSLSMAAVLGLCTRVFRGNTALSMAGAIAFGMLMMGGNANGIGGLILQVVSVTVLAMLMVRMGLVAMLACCSVLFALPTIPLVFPGESWYWNTTAVMLGCLAALAAWGLHAARSHRALVRAVEGGTYAPRATHAGTHAPFAATRRTPPPASRQPISELPTRISPPPAHGDASEAETRLSPPPPDPPRD